jgi:eukaryotic-like serine/threonine-protein kinase
VDGRFFGPKERGLRMTSGVVIINWGRNMTGTIVSHYRILEKLGEGGMGVVYKAEDTRLQRIVALKFLPSALLVGEDDRRRFVHEAQASASLSHPNIATVFEIDESEAQTFIALEYVEGQSLAQKIASGPLKLEEALSIAIQVSEGLHAAHEKGIVHRDIKGQNLMVETRGQVKILDFGLAKLRGASGVTKTGTIVGTMGYASPEQLRGDPVDHRTDLWATGVVLYEMIAGRRPFQGEFEGIVTYQIMTQQPDPLTAIRTGVPIELERIVNKLLAKNAVERYQSTTDLLVDLKALRRTIDLGTTQAIGSNARASRNRRWLVAAIGGSFLLTACVALVFHFRPAATSHQIRTIAVLPLKSLTQRADQEHVTEGMQMALINELSKVRSLTIISSQSSSRFRNSDKSAREIAAALGADALLGGSALLDGITIRVSLQLIDGQSDRTVWSDQYDKPYSNILALHSEVARAVTDRIRVDLSPEETRSLTGESPVNPEAYDAYQRGLLLQRKKTPESTKKAKEYFERAIELDEHFASAYARLSSVYYILGVSFIPPSDRAARQDAITRGRLCAKKALELDGSLPAAHASLGAYLMYDWDLPGAEGEYREAVRLNPGDADACEALSSMLNYLQKHDEAIAYARRAKEIDPLYWARSAALADALYYAGRYDEALVEQKKAIELEENSIAAWMGLGDIYLAEGLQKEGILAWARAHELDGNPELARAYRDVPFKQAIRKWLDQASRPQGPIYNNPSTAAWAHELIGNRREAVRWLEIAFAAQDQGLLALLVGPQWSQARSDPRVRSIVKRMGLERYAMQ